jgi:hypothetical protein
MSFLPLVRIWIWISVFASFAGWGLSALGQLNRGGYLVLAGLLVVCLVLKRQPSLAAPPARYFSWPRVRSRFRRFLPACFFGLALLVLLGGLIYPPTNHTALTYRTPRVLNWLAEGHWHWIYTEDYRLNNRACGIEWLSAPLLLFTRSDRGLFLINYVSFLLMPGLIYSVFTRLGVRPRVAWYWMWLLPTGYNFLLQAGSAGNDTFPTVYALAALDFGLRAWSSRRDSDLWLSGLSAALLTGAKASNLPLLLPWGILILPLIPLLRRRFAWSGLVLLLGAVVSFLPTAWLNIRYCGDWSGLSLERTGMDMKNPLVGIWGNALLFALDNFTPPVFPLAGWWNQSALTLLPQALVGPMVANFEPGFHLLWELPTEDWTGIGFGISALLLVSMLGSLFAPRPSPMVLRSGGATPGLIPNPGRVPAALSRWVMVASWIALLAYCVKSGMVTGARLISPYYPLLFPLLLLPAGQAWVVRRRWWRFLTGAVLLMALGVLVVTPARPLWPARTILSKLLETRPNHRLLARGLNTYAVYSTRSDPLASVRALLPGNLEVVGFLADPDDMDISLWRPFGSRRVRHVRPEDPVAVLRRQGIQYVVVGAANMAVRGIPVEDWVRRVGGTLAATAVATVKVAEGPQKWHVVRLPD